LDFSPASTYMIISAHRTALQYSASNNPFRSTGISPPPVAAPAAPWRAT
jgi:hypothetical protein